MSLLGRNALYGTAVMAALGVPFALSDKDGSSLTVTAAKVNPSEAAGLANGAGQGSPGWRTGAAPVEGPAVVDLAEVLRFDITPAWLTDRWPRVMNARHAAGPLQAYRVPLVTGAKPTDIAGSLTYYFDEQQKLQRIQFQGHTGDSSSLVTFLSQKHNFQRRMAGDPSQIVYEVRRDGAAASQLIVRNAPLIDASMPQSRFRIELALERPTEHRIFSDASSHRFDSLLWP